MLGWIPGVLFALRLVTTPALAATKPKPPKIKKEKAPKVKEQKSEKKEKKMRESVSHEPSVIRVQTQNTTNDEVFVPLHKKEGRKWGPLYEGSKRDKAAGFDAPISGH